MPLPTPICTWFATAISAMKSGTGTSEAYSEVRPANSPGTATFPALKRMIELTGEMSVEMPLLVLAGARQGTAAGRFQLTISDRFSLTGAPAIGAGLRDAGEWSMTLLSAAATVVP